MELREIAGQMKGFGAPPTAAVVDIAVLSGADRLKRAAMILGVSFVVALIALPIPLVHFVLVPGALAAGFLLAGYRLTQAEIFRRVSGKCPFCGAEQTFPIMGKFRLPRKSHCSRCRRELSLDGS